MSEAILVALISGGATLAGVILTGLLTARKNESNLRLSQAVTDTKLEELTREVRLHNDFARRMPVVEEQIKTLSADIRELKRYHTPTSGKEAILWQKN